MGLAHHPRIVNDEIKLCIDAGHRRSYSGTGTTINNLVANINNPIYMVASPTWNSDGYWSFDGAGEVDGDPTGSYLSNFDLNSLCFTNQYTNGATYSWWSRVTDDTNAGQAMLYGASTISHVEFRGVNGTTPYFRTEAALHNGYSFGSGTIPGGSLLNKWINFAIVFDHTTSPRSVRWYKDGQLFYTDSNFDDGNSGVGEYFYMRFFGRSTGTSAYLYANSFYGDLANFYFYGKPLTSEEVHQNFEALKYRFGV